MRILQVVEPGIDGVFRVVETLIKRLIAAGHRLALAYSDQRGSAQLGELVDLVDAHGGATLNLAVGNAPEAADLSAFWRLHQLTLRFQPDVIHAHSSKAGALARSLRLLGVKARYVYTPHAYYGLSGRRGLKAHLFNGIERGLGHIGASCMSSVGEGDFARQTLRLPANRLHVVGNPIDADAFQPAQDRARARASFGLPEDAIVLGSVGRLSFQKDPETLYRAVAPLLASELRLHLFHIGTGELDEQMRTLAAELHLTGRLTRVSYLDRPAEAYQAMDALALSSRYEGLSVVSLEALACDLPLILTRVQGVADLQPERLSHCWTAPPGDVPRFTAAIETWLADRSEQRPSNHRAMAIEHFSVQSWLDRHLHIYQPTNAR